MGYDAVGVANSAGHLTSMGNSTATMSYGPFDAMGNVLASSETTGGGTYNFSYGYNLAGALTQKWRADELCFERDLCAAGSAVGLRLSEQGLARDQL
jgi:hypothetical protein